MPKALRPHKDRVRETLFNWLGQTLYGKTCLDLFAGSGALGFRGRFARRGTGGNGGAKSRSFSRPAGQHCKIGLR